jgi:hypothetical protein
MLLKKRSLEYRCVSEQERSITSKNNRTVFLGLLHNIPQVIS